MAQVAAGDTGAPMSELYRRYAGRLYRYGLQALGDGGLAEEMVQESFVRLWRTAGRFDPARGSVAAYLIVIGRSVAADVRKRPSSRRLEQLEEARVAPQPDSVDQILSGLMVREAVDSLSPRRTPGNSREPALHPVMGDHASPGTSSPLSSKRMTPSRSRLQPCSG